MASRPGTTSGATPGAPTARVAPARPATGERAEQRVFERLRRALPAEYRIFRSWRWVHERAPGAPARDGESDLVIVHPEHGILVIEVKAHLRRDGHGRWFAGERLLRVSPFEQAETGKHALRDAILAIDGWPGTAADLRMGHGVAVPSQDLAATRARVPLDLGADAPAWMVLDQTALETAAATRRWVEEAYAHWNGDGRRGNALTQRELEHVERILAPGEQELLPSLRIDVTDGEAEVARLAPSQQLILDLLERQHRAAITGPAGTGKTVLAMEKARRLAQLQPTLLVCFNAPLARFMTDTLGPDAPRTLEVLTFHELCLRLVTEASTATEPPREQRDRTWFDSTLPSAAFSAIDTLGPRYRAIVVDEGQDFQRDWLELLQLLLVDPATDAFCVFHDPLQGLFREDVVDALGLPTYPLPVNMRQHPRDP